MATESLRDALVAAGVGDVRADSVTRAAYSADASLYRAVPKVVVFPRDSAEVAAALDFCRVEGLAVTARGGGTSIAGNAVGTGVVLDFSRHMNRIVSVDAESRTAVVQPGVVQSDLQAAVAGVGLRFGPDPSSSNRCTIGGMAGNNACGTRALGYGTTADNVVSLRGFTGQGMALESATFDELQHVVAGGLATIRTEFGRFGRQVSGYSLQHLLPENRFDVAKFLVGSEGTLAVLTEATVRLVRDPAHRVLVVLGYPDIAAAGDATPAVLAFGPTACEGIDSRIVDVVRIRRTSAVPQLPLGRAWLFVELAGPDIADVLDRAERVVVDSGAVDARIVTGDTEAGALWRIRADGAGLSSRSQRGRPAHAGWEDAAVPPGQLGGYLREFDALLDTFDVEGLPYGHFGDGCLHIRIDFPLHERGGDIVFREFVSAAADLVARFGGSFSGEHGDGRARSELLPRMYSADAIALFGAVKRVFDPDNLLNPGILVDPRPLDADLRITPVARVRRDLAFAYAHDGGDFGTAVQRCTGVGKCRAVSSASHDVMCPSFQATREEKDSTRGRARVLQEMLDGSAVHGWDAPAVHDALDLCLACKGCVSDCPTGVDMATLKAEVLHQRYRRRLRPAGHYSLGWLPRWARLAGVLPRAANRALRTGGIRRAALRAAGVDARRSIPEFAPQTFRAWFAARPNVREHGDPVLLFVDSFTNHFTPNVGIATVRVLEAAGYSPRITRRPVCCGLTWITTGQLDAAKRILRRTLAQLDDAANRGIPIVGMEPSCTAVLRSDAVELVGGEVAEAVAGATRTLAELLTERSWTPPARAGTRVVAQPHCHHHAVLGWQPDEELLRSAQVDVERVAGCCGLAGNFGVEVGHYDVSVAVAEANLLPAVRRSGSAVVLADGFSCRTQLADLADCRGLHLAEFLAAGLD